MPKNNRVGSLSLLQKIFPTQEFNRGLLDCSRILYQLSYQERPSACNAGDLGSTPGSRRGPGEGNRNPLQYSCLENPIARVNQAGCSPRDRRESHTIEKQKEGWLQTLGIKSFCFGLSFTSPNVYIHPLKKKKKYMYLTAEPRLPGRLVQIPGKTTAGRPQHAAAAAGES